HVTAPLRRLVDRYATEVCLAIHGGRPVPDWVRRQAPALPEVMRASDRLAHDVDRVVVDTVEAGLLRDQVGDSFAATVLDADDHGVTVALDDPVVRARARV